MMNQQIPLSVRVVAVFCAWLMLVPSPMVAAQASSQRMKELVQIVGVGAEVKVTLAPGEEMAGVIREVGAEQFVLDLGRRQSTRHFSYAQVRNLSLARMKYKAAGATDVAAVNRIVAVVGPGKYVQVRLRDSRKVRGRIQVVGQDEFTLLAGGDIPFRIAYADVAEVKPKPLSTPAKAVLITTTTVLGSIGAIGLTYVIMRGGN